MILTTQQSVLYQLLLMSQALIEDAMQPKKVQFASGAWVIPKLCTWRGLKMALQHFPHSPLIPWGKSMDDK